MTAKLKKMIHVRNCAYKQGKTTLFRFLRNRVKHEIGVAKERYYKVTYPEIEIKKTQSSGRKLINLWEKINLLIFSCVILSPNPK